MKITKGSRFKLRPVGTDELLEDTVMVPQSITPDGEFLRRRRVQVAGGETTKTSVAKTSIALLINEVFKVLIKPKSFS